MRAIFVCDLHGEEHYEMFRLESPDSITYECIVCQAEEILTDYSERRYPA